MTGGRSIENELVEFGNAWRYFLRRLGQQRGSRLGATRQALAPLLSELGEEVAKAFPDGQLTLRVVHGRATIWVRPRLPRGEDDVELLAVRTEEGVG